MDCPQCGFGTMRQVAGSIIRCSQCGHQEDTKAKKHVATIVSAPYVQPGGASPGAHFPALSHTCPSCGLEARRIGSAKFEFRCDCGCQFSLNATGINDVKTFDPAQKAGPIAMGAQ
jgi:ribosomal protein L37AE/L43A